MSYSYEGLGEEYCKQHISGYGADNLGTKPKLWGGLYIFDTSTHFKMISTLQFLFAFTFLTVNICT